MNLFGLLVCALLFLNTTLRFFTNYFHVLPKVFNIIDVMFVGVFFLLFIGHRNRLTHQKKIFGYLVMFNFILMIGAVLNLEYLYPQAVASQIIMWNEPIVLFLILVNLPFSPQDVRGFNRLLFFLIIFEFIIGVLQVPIYLQTGESESIIGTFHGNAEQYGAFLMIGIFYLIGKLKVEPLKKVRYSMIILTMLALILLIDNKASWIGIALSLFYLMHRLGKSDVQAHSKLKYVFAFSLLALFAFLIVMQNSTTLYKYAGIKQAWETGNFLNLGKPKAYRDVLTAYAENPQMAVAGAGPGTFYSRSASQFFALSQDMFIAPFFIPPSKKPTYKASDSMGGIIEKANIEPFFKTFFFDSKIYALGSSTSDDPFFSFVALLGETGMLGTLLYLGIYAALFKKLSSYFNHFRNDSFRFPLIVSTTGFLVYIMVISTYNNWLETGRLTTILWSMAAMVLKSAEFAIHPAEKLSPDCRAESMPYRFSPV